MIYRNVYIKSFDDLFSRAERFANKYRKHFTFFMHRTDDYIHIGKLPCNTREEQFYECWKNVKGNTYKFMGKHRKGKCKLHRIKRYVKRIKDLYTNIFR
jgi:hypothetical protein